MVPDVPALTGRRFDYTVPERWRPMVAAGTRVRVPLGGRRVGAWVSEVGVDPPPGVVLRDLSGYSGLGPPPGVLDLVRWAAWRWAVPEATLLRTASPERNVLSLPTAPAPVSPAPGAGSDGGSDGGPTGWPPGPSLVREGPSKDLLGLVLDVVAGADGPVLVLVPSTGWAARLAERLRRRGVAVAAGWAEAAAGWPVVVGSRAAAWAPAPRLGAAVVLDAHDLKDRYDAAAVVAERARRDGAPCVLVSPCPTAVEVAEWGPARVRARSAERAAWPAVVVADRRRADPRTGLYSEELVRLARRVLPDRLVCVLNRTGRARLLACAACGELARCTVCGRSVGLDGDDLACPACGARRPVVCPACGGTRMKVLRQGVSRAREELSALLGVEVAEVSGPPARRRPAEGGDGPAGAGASAGEWGAEGVPADAPVVVGTEAVLHRVRHAAAVCFLDFDQHLLAPRFGAAEESLALLCRAGRLVGGREGPTARRPAVGTVLVQTRLPDHEVVVAAVAGDPSLLTELELRRELRLPPASALATVRADAAPRLRGVEVSPAGPGRWLVRAPDHSVLCDAVSGLHGGVRVDPDDV